MSEPIIRVENLGKKYLIRHQAESDTHKTLRDQLAGGGRALARRLNPWAERPASAPSSATREEFWALNDVSFEVKPGEVVGIIGRNGAGKSTLLKVLSRITEPTRGRVELGGRVASLLEVGTGFHPELSGRENVYLNGTILGMTRREIARKFDEIVAFAGVEKFLDTPVKRYSSGMYVRLAFAVAAHLEPEILIVDEVLAVGDAEFQKKCLGKMQDVASGGRTVLFVSHNMAVIQNLCSASVLLATGQVEYHGSTDVVVSRYMAALGTTNDSQVDLANHTGRPSHATPLIRSVRLYAEDDSGTTVFACGGRLGIELKLDPMGRPLAPPAIGIGVTDHFGNRLFTVGTYFTPAAVPDLCEPAVVRCEIDDLPLAPGSYTLTLAAGSHAEPTRDWLQHAVGFTVTEADYFGSGRFPRSGQGSLLVRSRWAAIPAEATLGVPR